MASNSLLASVPKLKGRENYNEWAFAIENMLVLDGLSKCIVAVDEDNDSKAKARMILTIDPSLYVHIKEATSAVNLWKKLKSMFDDSGFSRRITLLRNLISIRLENCDSMTSYITQIIETAQRLSGTGFIVGDEWVGSLLLAGLPEKYFPMIIAIEHSGIAITADVMKTKLLDLVSAEGDRSASGAFLSRGQHSRQQFSKVGTTGRNDSSSHHGRRMSSIAGSNVNKAEKMKNIKCYRCGQYGHYKSQCKQNDQQVIKKTNAFSAVFVNGNYSKQDFYLDSGASVHMTPNVNMIKNASYSPKTKEIIAANESIMPVLCAGEVELITVTPNCKYQITLKDALCVPNLTTNLISISELIKNGNSVEFKDNSCYVYNMKKELVAIAVQTDGVYKLKLDKQQCLFTSATVSDVTWHRRMGHINVIDLNKMRDGAVTGISYSDKSKIDKSTCTTCCEGKQSRLPFPHAPTRNSSPLDLIHADVCGPMETTSIGGSRYFLVFIDDCTRMAFVYFLKTKTEVFKYFREFKSLAENQQNRKMKVFRTDNGLEFCSNDFETFLKNEGIVHQKTNAYTPEQNGVSERINRTIVERARCLLFDAQLDKKFWAEATNTAVYLRNRSVASGLDNKTPYEHWTGQKPDLSHIRIFGSQVMVHIPKEKRLKWDSKSKKHILVGFAENVKGYRVYNPIKCRVSTSRDVVVHELTEKKDDSVTVSVGDIIQSDKPDSHVKIKEETKEERSSADSPNISSEADHFNALTDLDSTLQQTTDENEQVQSLPTKRIRSKPQRYGYTHMCITPSTEVTQDPITVQEALSNPDKDKWIEAMEEELQAFRDNDAWEPVDNLPSDKTLVKCKWVFKRKVNSDNSVRYRARLVAKGFTQKPGIDYEETFSPVVKHSTLKLLFALSVQLNLNVSHLDVKTAFLNGYLKEDIYMTQPDIYCDKKKIVKLKKAIYGLKQSSRSWYERVEQCLCGMGFNKCKLEPCVFTKLFNNVKLIIAIYVDDFFVFSNCEIETEKAINVLSSEFKIKNLGQVQQCLGMRVQIDKNSNTITLDQEQYIDNLLQKFDMLNCKTVSTPMESKLDIEKGICCSSDIPYQHFIGNLMYLSVLTRPDIAFCISYLSQFNKCYSNSHWNYAKRVLKYLKKTKNYCLKYTKQEGLIEGFVDADWGSNTLDRRSYTGFCFLMSGSVISWECRKQRTVALSSMEAEYMAIAEAGKEAIYLRSLLYELTGNLCTLNLYNDSQSAQKLVANNVCHRKSKHIDIRYHFIKDVIIDKIINLEYLPTTAMPADILTKALCSMKHYKCMSGMGMCELRN